MIKQDKHAKHFDYYGFTLVELLVVIAIIGILISLLLPAVQAAREAARRMSCSNQQKQILLAIHNYHDSHGVIPIGTRGHAWGTWALQILPQIEQQAIFNAYDWNQPFDVGANRDFLEDKNGSGQGLRIPTFLCPSDAHVKSSYYNFAHHNYVACMGSEWVYCPVFSRPAQNTRNLIITGKAFAQDSQLRAVFNGSTRRDGLYPNSAPDYPIQSSMASVIDGTTNTVAISETIQGVSPTSGREDCRGLIWWGCGNSFNTSMSPNSKEPDITMSNLTAHKKHPLQLCVTAPAGPLGRATKMAARSCHTGGVNAALLDGSVRFIPDSVDTEVWSAYGTANGNEVQSSL
ncbi:MAG: DUF1559 domain-containing protein [Thermoguttaceae bacterium]